jgi:hypothetical protein
MRFHGQSWLAARPWIYHLIDPAKPGRQTGVPHTPGTAHPVRPLLYSAGINCRIWQATISEAYPRSSRAIPADLNSSRPGTLSGFLLPG